MRFEEKDLKATIGFLQKIKSVDAVVENSKRLPGMADYLIQLIEEYHRTVSYNKELIQSLSEIPSRMAHLQAIKENSDEFNEILLTLRLNVSDMYARSQTKSLLL